MSPPSSLERVIVVPRNGYANRLQAWASSAILAAQVDVPMSVLWEPEPAAGAAAADLFAPSVVKRSFLDADAFLAITGSRHQDLPRYLTVDEGAGFTVLAGHDRGEQAFMTDLSRMLSEGSVGHTLVIIAGGKFHLPDSGDFVRQRQVFYSRIEWSDALDEIVGTSLLGRPPFAALHIRQTDRSLEAPTRRSVRGGLQRLRAESSVGDLFIAADTVTARAEWAAVAAGLGFVPWSLPDPDLDRASVAGALAALADWRVLAQSLAMVYPAASTFSEEAAVASGHLDRAIALTASPARQRLRSTGRLAQSAFTYPTRAGWLRGSRVG